MSINHFSASKSSKKNFPTHRYNIYLQIYCLEQTCLHWYTFRLNMQPVFPVSIFEIMIVLKLWFSIYLSSLHDWIQRTHTKHRFIMNSDTLISIWILEYPIRIFEVSPPRKWGFLLYFSSIQYYGHPNTRISLVHNSWTKCSDVKNVIFSSSKYKKWTWDGT